MKITCFIVVGKSMKEVIDARRTHAEISRAIMKDNNELSMCRGKVQRDFWSKEESQRQRLKIWSIRSNQK